MSESIYEKIINRIELFGVIINEYVFNPESKESIYIKYGSDILDQLKYISEIDQFKKEFPENNERYLNYFLDRYERLKMFLAFPDKSFKDRKSTEIHFLSDCINQIILYLKGMLKPENQLNEQSKMRITVNESIYEMAKNRMNNFFEFVSKYILIYSLPELYEQYKYDIDPLSYIIEFDLLKIELPDSYEIYLQDYLSTYNLSKKLLDNSNRSNEEMGDFVFKRLSDCNSRIIEHLKKLLNLEDEIQEQKQMFSQEFDQLFSNDGLLLFQYLDTNYTKDNKSKKAKYSYIYHFLRYENKLSCNQDQYINFIAKSFNVKMSKIQPENMKYSESIQSLLGRLMNNFNKQK